MSQSWTTAMRILVGRIKAAQASAPTVPRVLIDLRMVRGPLHGIARYALELARRLPRLAPGWQFVGLVGPDGVPDDLGELTPRLPLERCLGGFLSPLEQ